jgi:hypothetical protein
VGLVSLLKTRHQVRRESPHADGPVGALHVFARGARHAQCRGQGIPGAYMQALDVMLQRVQFAAELDLPVPQDRDPVRHALQIADDVCGKQDGAITTGCELQHYAQQLPPSRRIEARGGFIENQHLGFVGKSQHSGHLLSLARRQRAHPRLPIEIPSFDQAGHQVMIPALIEGRSVRDHLPYAHPRIQCDRLRHIAQSRLRMCGQWSRSRRLKAREPESIPLVTRTPTALAIDRRDLPNRVNLPFAPSFSHSRRYIFGSANRFTATFLRDPVAETRC